MSLEHARIPGRAPVHALAPGREPYLPIIAARNRRTTMAATALCNPHVVRTVSGLPVGQRREWAITTEPVDCRACTLILASAPR